jgi:hypothetical protein
MQSQANGRYGAMSFCMLVHSKHIVREGEKGNTGLNAILTRLIQTNGTSSASSSFGSPARCTALVMIWNPAGSLLLENVEYYEKKTRGFHISTLN